MTLAGCQRERWWEDVGGSAGPDALKTRAEGARDGDEGVGARRPDGAGGSEDWLGGSGDG